MVRRRGYPELGKRVRHMHDGVLALDTVDKSHLRRAHAMPCLLDRLNGEPAAMTASSLMC